MVGAHAVVAASQAGFQGGAPEAEDQQAAAEPVSSTVQAAPVAPAPVPGQMSQKTKGVRKNKQQAKDK